MLLIHGFASTHIVNWVATGLGADAERCRLPVDRLRQSRPWPIVQSYEPADYTPQKMAGDAAALLRHLGIEQGPCHGLFHGRAHRGVPGDRRAATWLRRWSSAGWAAAWSTASATGTPSQTHCWPMTRRRSASARGKIFRAFADQTKSDRRALAACISTSRELLTERDVAGIAQPTLVAVGTKDDIGGSPDALARLMPHAESFAIEGRDHMLAVGDRTFKQRVVRFLGEHPSPMLIATPRDCAEV